MNLFNPPYLNSPWRIILRDKLLPQINECQYWYDLIVNVLQSANYHNTIHLSVFREPYLSYVLDGSKTVESRFSKKKIPPFNRVKPGDILLLKKTAGYVKGICQIRYVWQYKIVDDEINIIRRRFNDSICATKDFWESKLNSVYSTLMEIHNVLSLKGFTFPKKDRRGWVVLK